jgi:hypothetical protein
MMRRALGVTGRRVLCAGLPVVVAFAIAACDRPSLSADDLGRVEHGLAAMAAEATLLIEQREQGAVTPLYAKIHCAKMLENYHDVTADLDQPATPALARRTDAARVAARSLAAALQRTGDALARNESLGGLREELARFRHALDAGGAAS